MAKPVTLSSVADGLRTALSGVRKERRTRCRHPFACEQWVAPGDCEGIPAPDQFERVRCHDLSTCGISLLYPRPPEAARLVIALGQPPCLVYLEAARVHCTRVILYPTGKLMPDPGLESPEARKQREARLGVPMVLVGCCFLGRLEGVVPESPSSQRDDGLHSPLVAKTSR